ncbi:uncharacterized protein AMSG_01223 [Thecamonas trahens ATCC 50062]|uniref:Uncharacterized protein n=1 Tax=Thecamonas trahens ATCC 50062 TaxID=461836 RepID=A0A0L0DML2_THETB|nr:hypothetical protein AMSG_01223 [Thecamonas trahens ATCC 50062]KNC53510.1 hypothetical protein AMSG_01223 [Thecamonas trahens ATCC 50062]|eukprot:XP_013761831.1 hypothetical protein AMSG_01223 [Thecamonas trahens ATCC 50062]
MAHSSRRQEWRTWVKTTRRYARERIEALRRLHSESGPLTIALLSLPEALVDGAKVALADGDADEALALVAEFEALMDAHTNILPQVSPLVASAALVRAQGEWIKAHFAAAIEASEKAIAALVAIHGVEHAAVANEKAKLAGMMLFSLGDTPEMRALLLAAMRSQTQRSVGPMGRSHKSRDARRMKRRVARMADRFLPASVIARLRPGYPVLGGALVELDVFAVRRLLIAARTDPLILPVEDDARDVLLVEAESNGSNATEVSSASTDLDSEVEAELARYGVDPSGASIGPGPLSDDDASSSTSSTGSPQAESKTRHAAPERTLTTPALRRGRSRKSVRWLEGLKVSPSVSMLEANAHADALFESLDTTSPTNKSSTQMTALRTAHEEQRRAIEVQLKVALGRRPTIVTKEHFQLRHSQLDAKAQQQQKLLQDEGAEPMVAVGGIMMVARRSVARERGRRKVRRSRAGGRARRAADAVAASRALSPESSTTTRYSSASVVRRLSIDSYELYDSDDSYDSYDSYYDAESEARSVDSMLSERRLNTLRLEALTGLGGAALLPATMLAQADESMPRYTLQPRADEVSKIRAFLVDHIRTEEHVIHQFAGAALESNRIFHQHDPYRVHTDEDENGLLAQMRTVVGELLLDNVIEWFVPVADLVPLTKMLAGIIDDETTRVIDDVIDEERAIEDARAAEAAREQALRDKLLRGSVKYRGHVKR